MSPFNLITLFQKTSKKFDPIFNSSYEPPSPGKIRHAIEKLSRCPNCCFLIFDNYWTNEIEHTQTKVCPTCGNKL